MDIETYTPLQGECESRAEGKTRVEGFTAAFARSSKRNGRLCFEATATVDVDVESSSTIAGSIKR